LGSKRLRLCNLHAENSLRLSIVIMVLFAGSNPGGFLEQIGIAFDRERSRENVIT
jgi:hypothetical protein